MTSCSSILGEMLKDTIRCVLLFRFVGILYLLFLLSDKILKSQRFKPDESGTRSASLEQLMMSRIPSSTSNYQPE